MARHPSMASSVSKGSFEIIPDDFGALYLPYTSSLRQKQRAHSFNTGRYLQSLKIIPFDNNNSINLNANIFRSMQKNAPPHIVNMDVNPSAKKIEDTHCSCKAG